MRSGNHVGSITTSAMERKMVRWMNRRDRRARRMKKSLDLLDMFMPPSCFSSGALRASL